MKKNILFILIAVFVSAILINSVFAVDLGGDIVKKAGTSAGYAQATETTFAEILGTIVQVVLSFVGIVFLSLMVYAGYLWMTARGKEEQVDKAKTLIRQAIIGIVITLGAYSITYFIIPALL